MRKTYQVLANTLAVLVVVQAGAIAWAFFGLNRAIDQDGLVVNKACLEANGCPFDGEIGFAIHMGYNGMMLIPAVTLALLIVSFFAKVPRGVVMAVALVVLYLLQVILLPLLSAEVGPVFGALHGVNALVFMGVAGYAGRLAAAPKQAGTMTPTTTASV